MEKEFSLKKLLGNGQEEEKRKFLKQKYIGAYNEEEFEILPIDTKVSGVYRFNNDINGEVLPLKDYYISSIELSMYESEPLYTISNRYIEEDSNTLCIQTNTRYSKKNLRIKNKNIKEWKFSIAKLKVDFNILDGSTVPDENLGLANTVVDDEEILLPGEVIFLVNGTGFVQYTIESVNIDCDLSINYSLKGLKGSYIIHEFFLKKEQLRHGIMAFQIEI